MKFNLEVKIGNKIINNDSPTFLIAEAGVNHCGNIEFAKDLIRLAAKSGADAVKFQSFRADSLLLKGVEMARYQKLNAEIDTQTQYEMLKSLELNLEQYMLLQSFTQEHGLIFLTTPFEEESLDALDALNLPAYKIASTDLTNLPFLEKVAKKGKPILLSTGMSYFSEIETALNCIYSFNKDVVLLHCTSDYPVLDSDVNLSLINSYRNKFNILVGFSDHTPGIGAGPFAIAIGAKVLEKHFTLNKNLPGPDHQASLSPEELANLIGMVRKVDEYIGTDIKIPTLSETLTRSSLQKCLVARTEIKAGNLFSDSNTVGKRTGGVGISPIYCRDIYGKVAHRDFKVDEIIELDNI
jgi:N,N'-diacetyllegionaminate synthase